MRCESKQHRREHPERQFWNLIICVWTFPFVYSCTSWMENEVFCDKIKLRSLAHHTQAFKSLQQQQRTRPRPHSCLFFVRLHRICHCRALRIEIGILPSVVESYCGLHTVWGAVRSRKWKWLASFISWALKLQPGNSGNSASWWFSLLVHCCKNARISFLTFMLVTTEDRTWIKTYFPYSRCENTNFVSLLRT